MRILVTGGAGFIGSVLVPRLLHRGWHVTVLDRFPQGMPFLAQCCADPKFDAEKMDVRNVGVRFIAGFDTIINLAALVGAPICDVHPADAITINQLWTEHLSAMILPHQMLLQPTSDSGYGIGYEADFCTEESPLNPVSLYGRTKVEAEKYVLAAGGVSLRLASVFGMSPRMRLDLMVNEFVWRAVHDRAVVLFESHFRRNLVHIRDVVAAFLHAIDNYDTMNGQAFNCGLSSANMTKRQLAEKIKEHVPVFEIYESETGHDPDRRDYVVSNAKLEATGWAPRHTLDDGIKELITGYRMMGKGGFFNA